MPEMHLKQLGFTYSASGLFTKHLERIQKFRETGNLTRSRRGKNISYYGRGMCNFHTFLKNIE